MKVLQDRARVDDDRIAALVMTGDGKTEYRRLEPLAPRFGGDHVLWFPQRSERKLTIVGKGSTPTTAERVGLDALEALEIYKDPKYGVSSFLFLVDGEHIDGDAADGIRTKLRDVATHGECDVNQMEDGAFRCSCRVGSRELSVHAAVFGNKFGFIEDCIAKLLELAWDNSIEAAEKQEFKRKVNKAVAGGKYENLVDDARMEHVRRAFPNLSVVLESLQS